MGGHARAAKIRARKAAAEQLLVEREAAVMAEKKLRRRRTRGARETTTAAQAAEATWKIALHRRIEDAVERVGGYEADPLVVALAQELAVNDRPQLASELAETVQSNGQAVLGTLEAHAAFERTTVHGSLFSYWRLK